MHYLEQDLAQGGLGFGRINSPGRQFGPGCNVTVPSKTAKTPEAVISVWPLLISMMAPLLVRQMP
jgi:hypothetical protein